jgi:UDP-glucose 4-epimerase
VRFVEDDISDSDGWWTHVAASDLIVHCAASYDDRDKWHRDTDTNVKGAINVAIAARETGARVIYFQTALIYGNNPYVNELWDEDVGQPLPRNTPFNPENSYAISKLAAEQYLRHSGVPLLTFRLANIYGPRNLSGPVPTFFKRVTAGQPCTIVDSRRDFVYIDDLCDLVMQAIGMEATGTYHVSTGRDYPIGELYDAVVGALDAYGGPDPALVPRGADDAPTILLDPTETQRDFTWRATTDLDEGVERAVEWYRENPFDRTFTHLEQKG